MSLNTLPYPHIGPLNITGQAGHLDDSVQLTGRGISIRIVPASGGTIISIRNETNFTGSSDLYVIHESQDISAEIGKIITMHLLKKD